MITEYAHDSNSVIYLINKILNQPGQVLSVMLLFWSFHKYTRNAIVNFGISVTTETIVLRANQSVQWAFRASSNDALFAAKERMNEWEGREKEQTALLSHAANIGSECTEISAYFSSHRLSTTCVTVALAMRVFLCLAWQKSRWNVYELQSRTSVFASINTKVSTTLTA